MMFSIEDLKKRQSEFKAVVRSYLKEGRSIRSVRYEQFLKGIVSDLQRLRALTISSTAKTDLDSQHNFYSNLAGWMHVVNNLAKGNNNVIYIGIAFPNPLSKTA